MKSLYLQGILELRNAEFKIRKLSCVFMLLLCACTSSGEKSGNSAREAFSTRTGVPISSDVSNWEFSYVQIGDTYGEYYKFECTKETFDSLVIKLALKADKMLSSSGSAFWVRVVAESFPNDPKWWKLASNGTMIYHKKEFSKATPSSVMALWFDEDSSTAYLRISLWG